MFTRVFARIFALLVIMLLFTSGCSSSPTEATKPAERSAAVMSPSATLEESAPVETGTLPSAAVPAPTTNTPDRPTATPPLRSYALDAANLLTLVDLSRSQPLAPETTVNGRITPDALAVPYTYSARAGDVLLIELLLPDLPADQMHTIRPVILIADAAGNELGYMRGGPDFVTFEERRSIAQVGFVAPAGGEYTILATLDGHQNPQQNDVYEAEFTLTVTPATPLAINQPHEATPTPFTSSIVADATWETRLNHTMRVQFQIPAGWEVADGNNGIYGRDGASLTLTLEDHVFADAAAACQGLTQGIAAEAFGVGTGEVVTVNGLDVCVISRPQSGEPYRAIIKYPEPVAIAGSIGPRGVWNFLRMDIEPADYFWPIVESLSIPNEPSAQLYVSGVVDILKAYYYFRDQLDWVTLEAALDARLDENSTIAEAYDALRWLMEEMAAMVGHHHMVLRTPEQVQTAQQGQDQHVGLQMLDDVVTLVWPGSPAALAGLQVGDRIVTVNGAPFAEANFNADSFDVVVERAGQMIEATLTPQSIPLLIPPRSQQWGNVAYLETFGIDFGATTPVFKGYATTLHTTLNIVETADTCGWVLDLRRNGGGRLAPIVVGIAPLVGEGELFRMRTSDGSDLHFYYEDGRLFSDVEGDVQDLVDFPTVLENPDPPVAVLVSSGTGSGGELAAIVVAGQPNASVRVFGEQTAGLTTSVSVAALLDGGQFLFPHYLMVDAQGHAYPEGVIPDEPIPVVYDERYGTQDDPVVQAALAWLEAEHGCSP